MLPCHIHQRAMSEDSYFTDDEQPEELEERVSAVREDGKRNFAL